MPTTYPAAAPEDVISVYSAKLAMETDCADVHDALSKGESNFVLLMLWGRRKLSTAVTFPAHIICRTASFPRKRWLNGRVIACSSSIAPARIVTAHQVMLKLAKLGRRSKLMIGGLTGWADEGFAFMEVA